MASIPRLNRAKSRPRSPNVDSRDSFDLSRWQLQTTLRSLGWSTTQRFRLGASVALTCADPTPEDIAAPDAITSVPHSASRALPRPLARRLDATSPPRLQEGKRALARSRSGGTRFAGGGLHALFAFRTIRVRQQQIVGFESMSHLKLAQLHPPRSLAPLPDVVAHFPASIAKLYRLLFHLSSPCVDHSSRVPR